VNRYNVKRDALFNFFNAFNRFTLIATEVTSPNRITAIARSTHNAQESNKAFTLIELLVVMAIIAILIGLLFPAFRAVQDQAKRTQAKNDLTQIVNAVNAYYTTDDSIITNNATLMNALRATVATNNPRQIVFISPPNVKDTTNPRGGIGSDGQYYDPWGTPYRLRIDGNYDNQLANPYAADTGAGPLNVTIGVMTWSAGKDQKAPDNGGTNNFNASDDVISWQ